MLTACIAVPAGLIAGSIFSTVGYRYLTTAFSPDDAMAAVIKELVNNHEIVLLKPWMYVMAVVVTLLTVALALLRPMQIASKISPVEAMRYDGSIKTKKKVRKGHLEMNLIHLTGANLSRNKKRTIMTIVTLSLIGILFMVISTILSCLEPKEIARDSIFDDFILSVDSTSGELLHATLDAGFGAPLSFEEHNRRLPEVADVLADADCSGRAERFDAIERRLRGFFREAGDDGLKRGGGNVLVVTHSFVVRTLVYLIDPERVNDPVKIPNASVTRISYDGSDFRLGEIGSTVWQRP